ncbi:hypothetical protein [Alphaspiravirus yamagawaense]|uniref:Uncharacterized protein n=1 Tax=Alphaspiravirus yamagawaense TaxID=1157339 RepID=J7QC75_9VIRU|nr:hypothetical protein [Aeropyrum coil-shaped virus]CCG27854.1 hypothetical protein [Aeropyrum coil-shaped virus]
MRLRAYTLEDLARVYKKVDAKFKVVVGDIVACIYGYPCLAKDIDLVMPLELAGRLKNLPGVKLGEGKVVETEIDGINVSFNLEPMFRLKLFYMPFIEVSRINGVEVAHYSLERYVAGRLKRLIIMLRNGKENIYLIPYQLMDLVPILCDKREILLGARRILERRFDMDYNELLRMNRDIIDAANNMSRDIFGVACRWSW